MNLNKRILLFSIFLFSLFLIIIGFLEFRSLFDYKSKKDNNFEFLFLDNNKNKDKENYEIKKVLESENDFNKIDDIDDSSLVFTNNKTEIKTPEILKSVYVTGWSAGRDDYLSYLFSLLEKTKINSVVIDIKDYSGHISYKSNIDKVNKYNASQSRIRDIELLIKKLKEADIYIIGRVTIFQDSVLAKNRPDLAIKSKQKLSQNLIGIHSLWDDNLNIFWVDPASVEVWDYNIEIIKEAINLGFDEINLDYIRFPSDGTLSDMSFPFWDNSIPKNEIIKDFYKYLREELPEIVISTDLFGLTAIAKNDLGIGQIIEDAYLYFDYVSPMIYPSHFASGFIGYENPAEHPYEIINYSIKIALNRLKSNPEFVAKLRPWIQDFSIRGVDYDKLMIKAQIEALKDALGEDYFGYMVWSPKNYYTLEAFK